MLYLIFSIISTFKLIYFLLIPSVSSVEMRRITGKHEFKQKLYLRENLFQANVNTDMHNLRAFGTIPNLKWSYNKKNHVELSNFGITTFNLLAPCYKRLPIIDTETGRRTRESICKKYWDERASLSLNFFVEEIFPYASILALQEFWLDSSYATIFQREFENKGYYLRTLQRSSRKTDSVAFLIKKEVFSITGSESITLCHISDRVALLLWLKHKSTGLDLIIVNTHLSFPHNVFDAQNQLNQIKQITRVMERFALNHNIPSATMIITGDFNVELHSPVCNHLRNVGFYSCAEISPPKNYSLPKNSMETHASKTPPQASPPTVLTSTTPSTPTPCPDELGIIDNDDSSGQINSEKFARLKNSLKFVTHRNHRLEEVGVDHIFIKTAMGNINPYDIDNDDDDESIEIRDTGKAKVFISETQVFPSSLKCDKWNESFILSDHRPVGATVVVATRKTNSE